MGVSGGGLGSAGPTHSLGISLLEKLRSWFRLRGRIRLLDRRLEGGERG